MAFSTHLAGCPGHFATWLCSGAVFLGHFTKAPLLVLYLDANLSRLVLLQGYFESIRPVPYVTGAAVKKAWQ